MKLLYVTNSEKKVKELKSVLKDQIDIMSIDSLFDLEYSIDLEFFSRDLEEMARKKVQTLWKKEKNNYDYIIADAYGLFSTFAPNILGVDSDTWWPGTQRDRNEALVNLFDGVREREIYYYSVFVAMDKEGKVKKACGRTYGYLAKKVKERNGEGYDAVFITDDGKYLSHHEPSEIIEKYSARVEAMKRLSQLLK
jgi:non-canonical purine NTP pyrophosphatase (RdgB/HAM1 family)